MFSGRITRSVVAAIATIVAALPMLSCGDTAPQRPGAIGIGYSTVLGDALPFTWGVSVDGATPHNVNSADSGSFILDGVTPGDHRLIISSLPSICSSGSDNRVVSVVSIDTAQVQVAVRCKSTKATLRIATISTGVPLDPDGYVLFVGSSTAGIAAANNGSLYLSVSAGPITFSMKDIEPNCATTDSTRTVTVGAGDTLTVPFVTTSSPYPIGTTGISFEDPLGDTLPNPTNLSRVAMDLARVTTRYTKTFVTFTLKLTAPFANDAFSAFIDLDTDENAATGISPVVNSVGGSAVQGIDSYLFVQGPPAVGTFYAADGRTLSVRAVVEADSLIVYLPYSKLADSGNLTLTTLIGTNRPMDFASNSGSIVSHVPAGFTPGVATTRRTTIGPLRQGPVRWGRR